MATIIIEGCDGSGKTTLVNQLRQLTQHHLIFLRRSGPPDSADELIKLMYWIQRAPSELTLVLDRHPIISEKIYGPILRGLDRLPALTRQDVTLDLKISGAKIIYCRPTRNQILANVEKGSHLSGVQDNINQLIGVYDSWMYHFRQAGIWVRDYDYQIHNPELLLQKCFEKEEPRDTRTDRPDLQSAAATGHPVQSD